MCVAQSQIEATARKGASFLDLRINLCFSQGMEKEIDMAKTLAKPKEEKQIRIQDMVMTNHCGLDGLDFMEFGSTPGTDLAPMFLAMGFEKVGKHKTKNIDVYRQGDANFLVNNEAQSFAAQFKKDHGPSICSTGFRCKDAKKAFEVAVQRGAKPYAGDRSVLIGDYPVVYGIGNSLIYFIDKYGPKSIFDDDYKLDKREIRGLGFARIDHMTNNVPKGEMQKWCDFYTDVFGFKERRYFDIKGAKTGLISKVMISPCKKIMIPINEPQDMKSQIQEYIEEYKGSGIQHVALLTSDIVPVIAELRKRGLLFLDTPDSYFDMIPERVPNVTEPLKRLKDLRILVDGDEDGYLLQIFTKNMIGPIFFEVIQRKNHDGFGDGNFQALFDAIERDQESRGVL